MPRHILVVDDDALLRRSTAFNLEKSGYRADTAADAEDALAKARADPPDLVLLDIGLPGMDGLDALRKLKAMLDVPVIFVTARRRELDEVVGLELGADDYVTKPFDIDVLLARIKAVLRRSERPAAASTSTPQKSAPLTVGDLSIDPGAHSVRVGEREALLSPREFDLLYALALQAGDVVRVDDLLRRVWGAEFIGQPQVVYVHIRWLREKIERNPNRPERILTVRGVGYRLQAQGE